MDSSLYLPQDEVLVLPPTGRKKLFAVWRPRDPKDSSSMCDPFVGNGTILSRPNDNSRVFGGCGYPFFVGRDSNICYRSFVTCLLRDICMRRVSLKVSYGSTELTTNEVCTLTRQRHIHEKLPHIGISERILDCCRPRDSPSLPGEIGRAHV